MPEVQSVHGSSTLFDWPRNPAAEVSFDLPEKPHGKGRARSRIVTPRYGKQFVSHRTPDATRTYETLLKLAARSAMRGRPPFAGPIDVQVLIVLGVPASWSATKRRAALAGIIRPTTKPDSDNVQKSVFDACNKVIYRDDSQIVSGRYVKIYGEVPKVSVTVRLI